MNKTDNELDDFRYEVRDWLEKNRPKKPDFLMPQSFMEVGTDEQFHYLREWQQKVYEAGFLGMAWPREYGGGGRSQILQDIATQEMKVGKFPFMINAIGVSWAGPLILNMGTEEDKRKYIKGILSAEDIWCQGFSEPDHGSDLGNVQLKAERDGDDYILTGSKIWTTLGNYAKYMILLARTNPKIENKYAGLSYFLSPMKIQGVDPVPIQKLTGEYGFCQTYFDGVRIPASCLIGGEGNGWRVAIQTLQYERNAEGGAAGGPTSEIPYVHEVIDVARKIKRDGKPAIENPHIRDQAIKFLITEVACRANLVRDEIPSLVIERPQSLSMSLKGYGCDFWQKMQEFAMSLQGQSAAYYVGDDLAVAGGRWHRAYFNSFSTTIGGGTTEIQRNIVGERILGLPKS